MLYQYILAYGQYLIVLISFIGAGVLFFRTKTIHTGMFFFGLLFTMVISPISRFLSTTFGQPARVKIVVASFKQPTVVYRCALNGP